MTLLLRYYNVEWIKISTVNFIKKHKYTATEHNPAYNRAQDQTQAPT